MNEPILKLAMQAGMYVDLAGKPWPKWMSAEECQVAYAKFAELIVQECMYVVEDAGGIDKYHYTRAISQHFGVEE